MTGLITKEGLAAFLFGIFAACMWAILVTLYVPLLPRRVRVFNERCKRRFLTIFKGSTFLIPNAVIVVVYVLISVGFVLTHNQP